MISRYCLISLFTGALLMNAALAQTETKPNIVVMMTDNRDYGDLGSYGGVRADTPRIDELASEGVQFLNFQVEPGCTPPRAEFQTGRMPVRSGNDGYVEPGQPGGLHPKEVTLAELLKGVGYSTAMPANGCMTGPPPTGLRPVTVSSRSESHSNPVLEGWSAKPCRDY